MTLVNLAVANCCLVMFFSVIADAQILSSNSGQQVSPLKPAKAPTGLSADELQTFLTDFAANQQVYVTCVGGNTCNATICDEESVTKVCLPKFLKTKSLTAKFVETFSLATAAKKDIFEKCLTGKEPSDSSACVNCGGTVALPAGTGKDLKNCKPADTLPPSDSSTLPPSDSSSTLPPSTDPDTTTSTSTSSSSRTAGEVTAQGLSALAILVLAFL